jgi:hypothetical protein
MFSADCRESRGRLSRPFLGHGDILPRNRRVYYSQGELSTSARRIQWHPITNNWNRVQDINTNSFFFFFFEKLWRTERECVFTPWSGGWWVTSRSQVTSSNVWQYCFRHSFSKNCPHDLKIVSRKTPLAIIPGYGRVIHNGLFKFGYNF